MARLPAQIAKTGLKSMILAGVPGWLGWCQSCSSVDMWTPRKARTFSILIFLHLSLLAAAAPAHAQGTRMQRVRAASHELFHPEDSTRRLAQDSTTKRGNNDHGHVSTGTTPLGH
jgi:hypothetical protein